MSSIVLKGPARVVPVRGLASARLQACVRCARRFTPPPRHSRRRLSHTRTARIEDFLKVRCPRCKHFQDRQERYLAGLSVRQIQLAVALAVATIIAALSFVTP